MKKSLSFIIYIVLISLTQLSQASKLVEIKIVDKDYLQVVFLDGKVIYTENVNLPGAYTNDGDNSAINKVDWYGDKLNTTEAMTNANWTIISSDDSNFGKKGLKPIACFRKTKISGVSCGNWNLTINDFDYTYPLEHSIFIKLPKSLKQGKTYTIKLNDKILSDLTSKSIKSDIYTNISEAIHVNLVGYLNDASVKSADLYLWMGDGAGRDYAAFQGKKVYIYDVKNKTKKQVGSVIYWKEDGKDSGGYDLIRSNVWNADFTGFSTPGTYRLAIEDVGCSQDFTISSDAYYQPFMLSTRGYFYTRMNQDNMNMVPVPRRPLYIPGESPANTVIYLTTINPFESDWRSFTTGDQWDNNSSAGWELHKKPGNPTNTKVRGGHGDAFDSDRHLGHVSSLYDMLLPYILTNGAISDDNLGIAESGNGIPDILDEARNEVDFWLNLRDGKAYGHGLTNPNKKNILYQAAPSAVAAWANAANCAMLSNCFQIAGRDDLMKIYKDSAIIAYNFAGSLPDQQLDKTQDVGDWGIRGRDFKMMAAAYLYNVTGVTSYEDDMNSESLATTSSSTIMDRRKTQVWGTAGYLMSKRTIHYPALFENMKASIIKEAKDQEANNTLSRPSRRATDTGSAVWRTTQNLHRTMIAHAVTTNASDKAFFENALVLEADWGLGRNPLNMIQMTTASTSLETKRSVENMFTSGRNDGTPGVHPGQTPYTGTGNWGTGGGADPNLMTALCYPTPTPATTNRSNNSFDNLWPLGESYFNTRYCYANAEFTPQQTMRGKMALYGYLYGISKSKKYATHI